MKRIQVIADNYFVKWFPPFMKYTDNEKKLIDILWHLCGYSYIIDPLSEDQCVALQYDELPFFFKLFFQLIYGSVKTYRITETDYNNHIEYNRIYSDEFKKDKYNRYFE